MKIINIEDANALKITPEYKNDKIISFTVEFVSKFNDERVVEGRVILPPKLLKALYNVLKVELKKYYPHHQ